MASLICSNCGHANSETDANCKRCGASLTPGVQQQMSYPPPDAYYPQTPSAAGGDYVFPPPPSAGLYPQGGVWRNDSTLVMSKDAQLPDRCVKCNRPANGQRLKRTLYWHNPIYYILIFGGVLLYFIVAMFVRWKAVVDVPMCETHMARRRYLMIAGWLLFVLGLVGFVAVIAVNEPALALLAFLAIIVSFVLLIASARTVLPMKIDERFVWLKGINKDYLNQLPQWPGLA